MKTKFTFIFSLLFASIIANAQLSATEYTSKDFNQFKASKTYVILSGDTKYDTEMQAAIKDSWKITPFEFIGAKDAESKIADKSASFLALVNLDASQGNKYHYLALINGGKKNLTKYNYDDLLAYCPLNHFKNELKSVDCAYRVRNMVESMVLSMDIVQQNDLKGGSYKIVKQLQEFYNKKAANISKRTLLFCDETIGKKLTKADIAGIYPYKFELCSKDKIEQVIKDKSTDYYYFQAGITLNKSMFVFDPSNGEVLYFDFNMMGLDINKGNIEDFVKTMKRK